MAHLHPSRNRNPTDAVMALGRRTNRTSKGIAHERMLQLVLSSNGNTLVFLMWGRFGMEIGTKKGRRFYLLPFRFNLILS
ncbi:hypothetical protein [Rhodonellum sp.]|uniref:hypothetical protein n=1 Tax=Rhodonellum sp. TaxID=2231180 RepID=UPI0027285693|nr:hypothetical protein [Rhodonellum sp.]MDO9551917.1 hypothetical protein [Rhodonellum sp.]